MNKKDKVRSGRKLAGEISTTFSPRASDTTTKRFFIKTFGCQMNFHDSELIWGMLLERGFSLADDIDQADVILFNTCCVREHAEGRVWGRLGMLKRLKESNQKPETSNQKKIIGVVVPPKSASAHLNRRDTRRRKKIIGLVGCMAQNYKEKIFDRAPHVDLVCGPSNIYDIPDLIERIETENVRIVATDKKRRQDKIEPSRLCYRESPIKSYVTISHGCSNFCSYCIVPYVRGRQISRKPEDILREIRCLLDKGYKEITLLGQNVNSYGDDLDREIDFVGLLEKIDKIDGLERLRFLTSHPKDASENLFRAMRDLPTVCEHLHLPLQSGSDRILKLMDRGYTSSDYRRFVGSLIKFVPGCSLTTDIIVGFPGESESDFRQTEKIMREVQFDNAFIFKYSPRPQTKAARSRDDVPLNIKKQRNNILLNLQEEMSLRKNQKLIGKNLEVLVEEKDRGRTRTDKVTIFNQTDRSVGELIKARIDKVTAHALIGTVDSE